MHVKLIGIGCSGGQLTAEAIREIENADIIIGAKRMLDALPAHHAKTAAAYLPGDICSVLTEQRPENACVVFSGDTGFYSGVRTLLPVLENAGIEAGILPGISSLQTLSARIGLPWQDWKLCSAHGVDCDVLSEVMSGKPCFFLTGGKHTPNSICKELTEAGLGSLTVYAGENLGYPEENVFKSTAEEFSVHAFEPLCVLLTEAAPIYENNIPGIPDDDFIRSKVPMTKREIRAAILSALRVTKNDICWDIGAGTGSVSVELALNSKGTWALERKREALELIRENREKFRAWNLRIAEAEAPDGMDKLPRPDAVFIGGSGGNLKDILKVVHNANPNARICISAIAVETLSDALKILETLGYETEITQISVSRTKPVGGLHLLMAQNPIFLITGETK